MSERIPSIFDLEGRVAVVTGGNRGIGLAMALGLARAGATVSVWSRDESKNAQAVEAIAALGGRAGSVRCDVSSEDSVVEACARTIEQFGRIDVGIANAGFGVYHDPIELSLERWQRVLSTNLDGTFLTFREIAKHMIERGGSGKLIAVSSMVELFGAPKQLNYAASKGAIGALVRSYAVELARHDIQVNSIQPGWISTEVLEPIVDDEKTSNVLLARTPARRFGEPRDLEGIAIYLASEASRYHTGDSIRIDGGYSVF
ncbi:MAG: SDR family oxidoreductase [bacterium]|nr:2-deoxy-D-gluconate 3-dehydrogenase [Deltaproteobacteria bacterium]MCP4905951.1 SDR family oxidoreductase [bacterium]